MIKETPGDFLRRIAAAVDLVPVADFSGAVVFIPPEGDFRYHIMQSGAPSAKFFWAQAGGIHNIAVAEIDAEERSPYGR
jgi:hypothetical protein